MIATLYDTNTSLLICTIAQHSEIRCMRLVAVAHTMENPQPKHCVVSPVRSGAPLILSSPKSFRLTTGPVTMSLQSVSSAAANNATDNQWDARAGALPGDKLPEVPPDGEC